MDNDCTTAPCREPIERPMLMSGGMVRALLDGRKTQTRRIIKSQPTSDVERCARIALMPPASNGATHELRWMPGMLEVPRCPYGQPGDRLWVRETWAAKPEYDHLPPREIPTTAKIYRAADQELGMLNCTKHRPSISMPRWASRITLEITGVRVERLQDISKEDAKAEGVQPNCSMLDHSGCGDHGNEYIHYMRSADDFPAFSALESFQSLWQSINGPDSWDANPWVWVVEFRRL
jgi:hypothetical protein